MNYIYSDEDNAPMNEENFQRKHDHECWNCRHKIQGECEMWDCKFEPKYKLDSEGRVTDGM